FGLPAASMYSTDRYSFLKKIRFGRKTRVYRMLGIQYETDLKERKFVQVFQLQRGDDIDATNLNCMFLDMPEANAKNISDIELGKVAKKLKLNFIPPALERRCEETGITPEQYVMEAFFKGKLYSRIAETAEKRKCPHMLELDFVLRCTTQANNLLKKLETESDVVDWAQIDREWTKLFNKLSDQEVSQSNLDKADVEKAEKSEKADKLESEEREAEAPGTGEKKAARSIGKRFGKD
ncbi:MAG: hypothetical protein NT051_05010, partial [Candidatus Micrarchaeota archaeon]|nr:hypothetical protein [Candidatus Micrarchaeota archaeon]